LAFTQAGGAPEPEPERAWAYTSYTYGDSAHVHAATALSTGEQYTYDANGNMTERTEGGVSYTQEFDAENRLSTVTTITGTTRFVYDGDGQRVLQIRSDGTTVAYVSSVMEVEMNPAYYALAGPSGSGVGSGAVAANGSRGSVTAFVGGAARRAFTQGYVSLAGSGGGWHASTTTRLYYAANGKTVAVRLITSDGGDTLYYLAGDHLGSTSLTLDIWGTVMGQRRYTAYGATLSATGITPTSRRYTSQTEDGTGLYFYGARYYDPYLNRWIQPDSIVPDPNNPQALNRYSYAYNRPLNFTDPTGFFSEDEIMKTFGVKNWDDVLTLFNQGGLFEGKWGFLETLRQAQAGDHFSFFYGGMREGWLGYDAEHLGIVAYGNWPSAFVDDDFIKPHSFFEFADKLRGATNFYLDGERRIFPEQVLFTQFNFSTPADKKYTHVVNGWNVGLDAVGVATCWCGGDKATDAIKAAQKAGRVASVLSIIGTGASTVSGQESLQQASTSVGLSAASLALPPVISCIPSIGSLAIDLHGFYIGP
jgi:RHS repeat-associated protein